MLKEQSTKRTDRLRLGNVSDDERFAAWCRVAERICNEHLDQGWDDYMFRLLRTIFLKNNELFEQGGFIFDWIAVNYAETKLMLLRRELDFQAGTENLRNLLLDIIENPRVLTQACSTANPAVIKADLDHLAGDAEKIRVYAERTRAHRAPSPRDDDPDMTFQVLDEAVSDVRRIVGKYYKLLIRKTMVNWEPVPQFNTIAPFLKPWVLDLKAVKEAIRKSVKT